MKLDSLMHPDHPISALLVFTSLIAGACCILVGNFGLFTLAEANKDATTKVQKGIIKDYHTGQNGREH
jgi:hypothetical protein